MDYISYTINSTEEILIGLLSAFPFESFEEQENHIVGYISSESHTSDIKKEISTTIERFTDQYSIDVIKPQNWNALWESSFEPVIVDHFCSVRADFHDPIPGVKHDLVINPKMAFGTGHHETTYMMMAAMEKENFMGKSVFDFGCGTGVLAILASKLGANPIDAIDIEQESYENTLENAQVNKVVNINVAKAILEEFELRDHYDYILANINRNVLLAYANHLYELLQDKGKLFLSGILEEDVSLVCDHYKQAGFSLKHEYSRGYWKCLEMMKEK